MSNQSGNTGILNKFLLPVLLVLSLGLLYINYVFQKSSHFSKPQFQRFDSFEPIGSQFAHIRGMILNSAGFEGEFYRYFFYLDFLWAAILLICIWFWCRHLLKFYQKGFLLYFSILCIIAYSTDSIENCIYLDCVGFEKWAIHIKLISNIKTGAYFLVLLIPALVFYFKRGYKEWKIIWTFLKSALLSIIILSLIVLLITQIGQGATIILALFDQPANLLLAFILVNYLALILSHYPAYFKARKDSRVREIFEQFTNKDEKALLQGQIENSSVEWTMHKPRIFGLGMITYRTVHPKLVEENNKLETLWRGLGIMAYFSWIYVLGFTLKAYLYKELPLTTLSILSAIALLWYYLKMLKSKEQLRRRIDDYEHSQGQNEFSKILSDIRAFLRHFFGFGFIFIILLATTLFVCKDLGWSISARWLVFSVAVVNLLLFVHFRLSRSLLHYWAFHPGNISVFSGSSASDFNSQYYNYENDNPGWIKRIIRWPARLSDHVCYLKGMRNTAFCIAGMLIYFNLFIQQAIKLNALNIIISYLIIGYGAITTLVKHWIYYSSNQENLNEADLAYFQKYQHFFNKILPVLLVGVFVGSSILRGMFSGVHELPRIEESENVLSLTDYSKTFKEQIDSGGYANIFHIASYGGGLKANLWNLLVINELSNLSSNVVANDRSFLNASFSFSGVSGGALGLANFLILHNSAQGNNIGAQIQKIGGLNVLGIDIVSMVGRDYFLEHFNSNRITGKDRSYQVMKKYALISGMEKQIFEKHSFRNTWYDIFDRQEQGTIPILLVNSSSTGPEQGYGLSVAHSYEFPGGLDIARPLDNQSLSFYSVVSTSNRFPLFSPSAKIEKRGYFLDGGYFENSGLLSTDNLIFQVERINPDFYDGRKKIFINIINGRFDYIRDFIIAHNIKPEKIRASGEISSIIKTLTNIDKLPITLREIKKDEMEIGKNSIVSIFLPHMITIEDLENVLKGKIQITTELLLAIEKNNEAIVAALKTSGSLDESGYDLEGWGIVEPPLARVLSLPAVKYQQAMVTHHVDLRAQIDRIDVLVKEKIR